QVRGARETTTAGHGDHRPEGTFVAVGRMLRQAHALHDRQRQRRLIDVWHLQPGTGDGYPALMCDADLNLCTLPVFSQEADLRRPRLAGKDLYPAAREANRRPVEALDDRFFGRPAT